MDFLAKRLETVFKHLSNHVNIWNPARLLDQLTLARPGAVIWRGKECPLPQMIYWQGTDPWAT
jgi:hypothetical protein